MLVENERMATSLLDIHLCLVFQEIGYRGLTGAATVRLLVTVKGQVKASIRGKDIWIDDDGLICGIPLSFRERVPNT
jgi:hypothetical protein